eukprot:TRINITY_DN9035_c2_g1_i1.p1 TRINITY_DN9035_c2_g1~~TRINITY_DN9035_c2_g1_i1.p1  ORF type:complete len:252 (+),score=40.76 TRINITY_DN9035_c2_g1_i1:296-1051(+)
MLGEGDRSTLASSSKGGTGWGLLAFRNRKQQRSYWGSYSQQRQSVSSAVDGLQDFEHKFSYRSGGLDLDPPLFWALCIWRWRGRRRRWILCTGSAQCKNAEEGSGERQKQHQQEGKQQLMNLISTTREPKTKTKAGDKGADLTRIVDVPLNKIRRPLSRTRQNNEQKISNLMASIKEVGLLVPIDVLEVDGVLYGFSGCHRFEAHQRLSLPTIRCRILKATPTVLRMHMPSWKSPPPPAPAPAPAPPEDME